MKILLKIFIVSLFFISSSNSSKNKVETVILLNNVELNSQTSNVIESVEKNLNPSAFGELEENIKIMFEDFSVSIDSIEIWDEDDNLKQIQKDTANIYIEYGETVEGKVIRVKQTMFDKVEIFQRFENSITIMNEGPHYDLIDWKHYYSDWKLIEVLERNIEFETDSYSEEDCEKFIPIEMSEIIEAVAENCGEGWAEHIKKVKTPTEYPCSVGTSHIFLKIILQNEELKLKQEKIIAFKIPMGC